ncbi:MAG: AAA family ATPase, partial [Clostridia bacterium]|nr:AAA family ATPase [Clostridia bacterium]
VGASRVRDLFENARKHPASIIFIDEIDAVGRHRGAGLGGGHDEREQTLNQILVEMDGFGSSEGIIVMAATNRPDILDPALLRPGRFDRQITMNAPDVKGREDILKVHAKNKPFEEDVDLSVIAKTTVGFTGAELANLLNEAALLAARKGKHLIGMNDLEEAMIKVIVGPAKKSRVISEAEKKLTAYHEAGHAISTWVRQPDEPVHQISIIPAGRAGGYTLSFPKEDKSYMSRGMMESEIVTLLGGRVAEQIILGDISTGASNDIQRASSIARSMVTKYGMSEKLGPILYGSESSSDEVFLGRDFNQTKNYSDETAAVIDAEVKEIVTKAYAECKRILEENIDRLHFVAAYLMKNEIMEEEQFVRAMSEPGITIEALEEMVAEKRRKSQEENERHARHMAELEKQREEERARAEAREKDKQHKEAFPPFPLNDDYRDAKKPDEADQKTDESDDGEEK